MSAEACNRILTFRRQIVEYIDVEIFGPATLTVALFVLPVDFAN